MNKHLENAIIDATVENLIDSGIENPNKEIIRNILEVDFGKEVMDAIDFDDFETFVEELGDDYICKTSKETKEDSIEKIIESLHVGYNFVPGVGFGYCSDEKDLEKMKEFVRGGLVVKTAIEDFLS